MTAIKASSSAMGRSGDRSSRNTPHNNRTVILALILCIVRRIGRVAQLLQGRDLAIEAAVIVPEENSDNPCVITVPRPFRVLCTAKDDVMAYGSYRIRCKDFKYFAKTVASDVQIDTTHIRHATGSYNATLCIKSLITDHRLILAKMKENVTFGRIFLDVVDAYELTERKVPLFYEVITQNSVHAAMYPRHKRHVVTHWYNSFPGDTGMQPFNIRPYEAGAPLQFSTVRSKESGGKESVCNKIDSLTVAGVNLVCVERTFNIELWYREFLDMTEDEGNAILANQSLGPGYLYYKLFRNYDALIVFAKDGPKLDYGNVQRAVSQMRSAVPILLEDRGKAHSLFVQKYNYTCTFGADNLVEAIERMKSAAYRRSCQEQAFRIVAEFSPEKITMEFLRVLGYRPYDPFACSPTL